MGWKGFPFCLFGFVPVERTSENAAEADPPTRPLTSTASASEDERSYDPWTWPPHVSIPSSVVFKFSSFTLTLNFDLLYYTIFAATIGMMITCGFYLMARRKGPKRSRPEVQQSDSVLLPMIDRDLDLGPGGQLPPPTHEDMQLHLGNHRNLSQMIMNSNQDANDNHQTHAPAQAQAAQVQPSKIQLDVGHAQTQSSVTQLYEVSAQTSRLLCMLDPDVFYQFGSIVTFEEEIQISLRNSEELSHPIILHQFPRGKNHPCLSPHTGLKVEASLRMCGIPYEVVFDGDINSGPIISYGNETYTGVYDCIKFLHEICPSKVKGHLPTVQKKVPVWYIYMILDLHLAWSIQLLETQIQTEISQEEILSGIRNDLAALVVSIGEKEFFIGQTMTELDCSAFAILAQFVWPPEGHKFGEIMQSYPALTNFCNRVRNKLWKSDWESAPSETPRMRMDVEARQNSSIEFIQSPTSRFMVQSMSYQGHGARSSARTVSRSIRHRRHAPAIQRRECVSIGV